MTKENVLRLYNHYCKIASGNFKSRDFDTETPGKNEGDEEGHMVMGKLTPKRIELIKSDALVNKLYIEEKFKEKFQELKPVEKPKVEAKTISKKTPEVK